MKRTNYYALILGSALMLAGGTALAATIVNSKHDLSGATGNSGNMVASTDTQETCVFCHTPHAAGSTTVPLWNKNLKDGTGLTAYSSGTMDGSASFSGSTSMACLSCHDGTQAMDNMVNAPGSGLGTGNVVDGLGYTWSGTTVSAAGALNGGVALLGTDMGDDHPVAVPYAGGGLASGAADTALFTDPDFKLPDEDTDGNGAVLFWFENGTKTGMQSDEIRLFTSGTTYSVECASCHDPHNGNDTGEDNVFLRMANTSSAVCTSCHAK